MIVCNLASGSSGNCTYVETSKYKILFDIGRTNKYIVNALNKINVNPDDIDFVFITHTHDDHVSALHTFLKKRKAILVVTKEMFMQLHDLEDYHVLIYEDNPDIDGLDLKTFRLSHDAGDTRAFLLTDQNKSLVYITDTGYLNSRYIKDLKNKNMYCIESNHDIEMLTHGPYPAWLQKRMISDAGHLSNKFAGIYLSKMIGMNTNVIMLLHLSEQNNDEKTALSTVREYIDTTQINMFCAKKEFSNEVIEL